MNKGFSEIKAEDKLFCDFRDTNNPDCFNKLFKKLSPWLMRIILRIAGDIDAAEDILQETWIRIVRKKGFFDPDKGSFRYYLLTIAKNEAFKWRKKEEYRGENAAVFLEASGAGESEDPLFARERSEQAAAIKEAICELSQNYQDVLILYYFDDLKVNEIAELINKPSGTIKTWLDRGRGLLEKKLVALNR